MKKKHWKTLNLIFHRPASANIKWVDIESLLQVLGAEITEREGSRIAVKLFKMTGGFSIGHIHHPTLTRERLSAFGNG